MTEAPLIPTSGKYVREFGINLYSMNWPVDTSTSFSKNANLIARMIFGLTDYVAVDVFIHRQPFSWNRVKAHIRVARKGEVLKYNTDYSEEAVDHAVASLNRIWVTNEIINCFAHIESRSRRRRSSRRS